MTGTPRSFIIGLVLLLATGGLIGRLFGATESGVLVAALIALTWNVRQLLKLFRMLRIKNLDEVRVGEGMWQKILSQLSAVNERAMRNKQRYRKLFKEIRRSTDTMPDGVVILDVNNEIVSCNRAAKTIAGLKPKKDRGRGVDSVICDPGLANLMNSGDFSSSVEIPSPVDDDGWVDCRVVPYGLGQKLLFLRDITDRIRLSRTRRDFVANASHELRSPLTVICGYLDSFAEDRDVPVGWQKPIEQMREQAQRMHQIVAELLELSRLQSAGPANKNEIVDVSGLLASAKKASYQPGSTASIEANAESTIKLRGCGSEIESLISNLLSNALRHTPGCGQISLTWKSDAKGAVLLVEDTGEGIESEHIPRLTERFFRVDRGRTREDGGVGLGLAIVKHILSRHDAELSISSQLGHGSKFTCRFPLERIVISEPMPLQNARASA